MSPDRVSVLLPPLLSPLPPLMSLLSLLSLLPPMLSLLYPLLYLLSLLPPILYLLSLLSPPVRAPSSDLAKCRLLPGVACPSSRRRGGAPPSDHN